MTQRITKGQKFGDWTLGKFLGEGGNGFVWLSSNPNGEKVAIKLLGKMEGKNKGKVYARFRNEVNVVLANSDIDGLLPIMDYYLPDEITDQIPWYVMPIAQTLDDYLKGKTPWDVIRIILDIGKHWQDCMKETSATETSNQLTSW